jgi:hypothetical protein
MMALVDEREWLRTCSARARKYWSSVFSSGWDAGRSNGMTFETSELDIFFTFEVGWLGWLGLRALEAGAGLPGKVCEPVEGV